MQLLSGSSQPAFQSEPKWITNPAITNALELDLGRLRRKFRAI